MHKETRKIKRKTLYKKIKFPMDVNNTASPEKCIAATFLPSH
jgi:hypothetical protein